MNPAGRRRGRALAQMVAASPALRARERQIYARYADALRDLIAAEQGATPDDIRPRLIAEAVIAIHRESVAAIRRALLADLPDAKVAARVRRTAREAFTLLAGGFGNYAINEQSSPARPGQVGSAGQDR